MNEKNETKVENTSEEIVENVEESIEDLDEYQDNFPKEKKVKKHVQALEYVEKARNIVHNAEAQTEECKLLLVSDLKEYDNAKRSLNKGGLEVCTDLLGRTGSNISVRLEEDPGSVVFESKEDLPPMPIKSVSSGRFTGFIYALFAGAATAVGLIYLATEKLGITLDVTKIPSPERTQNIMTTFSTFVGLDNYYVGIAVFVAAVLFVTVLIYLIRTALKGNANLHFAVKQFTEAELYTEAKEDCKTEMDKVDAHMKDSIETLKMYEVLFIEQKGKLERILYVEGEQKKSTEYHEKSYTEIRETKELIETIKHFMMMPMSEDGKLSDKSVLLLQRAKMKMDKLLERLY
ncbi:hypothetical protein [Sulfurovum sp.]|uniref:hypothetical protein n=1 Tax=Sulfurovum sp. TaxID=1969726 RepID=UPI002867DBB0|nr:hypothetical protein [Sulfurovum sp.]